LRAIAAAERCCAGAESSGSFSRRQTAVTSETLQAGNAAPDAIFIADRGFGERRMEIGKGKAGAREMSPCVGSDLGPFLLERRGRTIEPPAPQKRCRVAEHQHRHCPGRRRPDVLEVDRAGAFGISTS